MKRNDINELHAADIFCRIVRSGSFANAARSLGVNPSSLTRTLRDLESVLGAQLLSRTTRRMNLTEAGTLYLQHAESMLAASRDAREAIATISGGIPRGHLRVSMPVMVGERLLGPNLHRFHEQYPELHLEMDLSDRTMPLVQGGFDLGLRIGRLKDSSLRARHLTTVQRVLVASPVYLEKHGHPANPSDLAQHACITLGQLAGGVHWKFWKNRHLETYTTQGWLHCTSPALALTLALKAQGILRLPTWVALEGLRENKLAIVLPDWTCNDPQNGGPGLYAIYTQGAGNVIPLKSRVFVDFVSDSLKKMEASFQGTRIPGSTV